MGARVWSFEVKVSLLRNSWARPALVAVFCALAVAACSGGNKKPKTRLAYEERPVELLYSTGADRMDKHLWGQAVDYFQEVERQHPYSEWSRRAILMQAFAHYQGNNYAEAIGDSDRFISLYPGNQAAAYAHYLKAVCYFEQIVDVGRDQAATGQALDNLREVTTRYPHTEYADRYQTTSHTPEALYRLVEAYLTLGLLDEAKKNGAVLGYNYPGDAWYEDAYRLLSSKGLRPAVIPAVSSRRSVFHVPMTKDKARTVAPPPAGLQTTASAMAAHRATDAAPTETAAAAQPDTTADTPPKKRKRSLFHIPFTGHKADVTGPDPDPTPTPTK